MPRTHWSIYIPETAGNFFQGRKSAVEGTAGGTSAAFCKTPGPKQAAVGTQSAGRRPSAAAGQPARPPPPLGRKGAPAPGAAWGRQGKQGGEGRARANRTYRGSAASGAQRLQGAQISRGHQHAAGVPPPIPRIPKFPPPPFSALFLFLGAGQGLKIMKENLGAFRHIALPWERSRG